MSFERRVRIPAARIGSLVGRAGSAKSGIESACGVSVEVDSDSGEVVVRGDLTDAASDPFRASEIVSAVGRGFSPEAAMSISGDSTLHIVDLRDVAGKSRAQIERVKGRIIGERGRARRNMEELSGTRISVYGRTVAVIGPPEAVRVALDAIGSLCAGSMHASVYRRLEAARRRQRAERALLWEGQNV